MGEGLTRETWAVGTLERPQEGIRREGEVEGPRAQEARRQERVSWAPRGAWAPWAPWAAWVAAEGAPAALAGREPIRNSAPGGGWHGRVHPR